jgi:GDP-L-fucose synthase
MEESLMRVYVTGGSGFLGKQIVCYLKNEDHEVCAPRSSECDLSSRQSIESWLFGMAAAGKPIEVIVNSAAYYGGLNITMNEPATILFKNFEMINNLFAAAATVDVKKIISVGSACAYPGDIDGYMSENDFWSGPLHESVEGYGFTKKAQLVAQGVYHKQHCIEGNHLILTNLYGPGETFSEYRGHAISVLIKRYVDAALNNTPEIVNWGDGFPIREFMYVEDAAKAIAKFVSMPHDLKPVNIGTGVGTSIKELTDLIAEFSQYKGKVKWDTSKPGGVPRKVLDTSRLKLLLPDYSFLPLREGLKRTIEWYMENKEEADKRK